MKMANKSFLLLLFVVFTLNLYACGGKEQVEYEGIPKNPVGVLSVPRGIHLTWAEDDVYHTQAISWYTRTGTGSIVYYDTKSHKNLEDYAYKVRGEKKKVRAGDIVFSNTYHDTLIKDLEPNTTYYFICGSSDGWSDVRKFKTMDPDADLKIAFSGDTRRTGAYGGGYEMEGSVFPDARIFNIMAIAKQDPDFYLFGGDFVMSGHEEGSWENWFLDITDHLIRTDGTMIPLVPTPGNHDLGHYLIPDKKVEYTDETDYEIYTGLFALPENELSYTLNFNKFRVISLYTMSGMLEPDVGGGERVAKEVDKQTSYLDKQLKSNDKPWVTTMTHYSTLSGYGIKPGDGGWSMIEKWFPLYEKYKVPFALTAHSHHYMRSWPIKHFSYDENFVDFGETKADLWPNGAPKYEFAKDSRNGTVHIMSGNAGTATEWFEKDSGVRIYPWMAAAYSRPSYTIFELTDETAHVTTYTAGSLAVHDHDRVDGFILDEFTLPFTSSNFPEAEYNVAY